MFWQNYDNDIRIKSFQYRCSFVHLVFKNNTYFFYRNKLQGASKGFLYIAKVFEHISPLVIFIWILFKVHERKTQNQRNKTQLPKKCYCTLLTESSTSCFSIELLQSSSELLADPKISSSSFFPRSLSLPCSLSLLAGDGLRLPLALLLRLRDDRLLLLLRLLLRLRDGLRLPLRDLDRLRRLPADLTLPASLPLRNSSSKHYM